MDIRKAKTVLIFIVRTRVRSHNRLNSDPSRRKESSRRVDRYVGETVRSDCRLRVVGDAPEQGVILREVLVDSTVISPAVEGLHRCRYVIVRQRVAIIRKRIHVEKCPPKGCGAGVRNRY